MKKLGLTLTITALLLLTGIALSAPGPFSLRLALSLLALCLAAAGLFLTQRAPRKDTAPITVQLGGLSGADEDAEAPAEAHRAEPLRNDWAEVSLDTAFYDTALDALFKNVVTYLNATSDPMSESLVKIREAIAKFLERIRAGRLEFERSDYRAHIHDAVENFKTQLTTLTGDTSETFKALTQEVDSIGEYMDSIRKLLENISDVAERVHVLSINASIESARAGEKGKGFKVISNEIQKLASETQRIVGDISGTVAVSNRIFASINDVVSSHRSRLLGEMAKETQSYDAVKRSVDRQSVEVAELYSHVMGFANDLEIDLKTLSPLAMLHSIVTQEIENLDLAARDFIAAVQANGTEPSRLAAVLEAPRACESIRKRLTTSRELDALEETIKNLGLSASISLKRTDTDVEFF